MEQPKINTIKELKKTDYQPKPIQKELADNLRAKITKGENSFEGLIGYDNTVIPDFESSLPPFLTLHEEQAVTTLSQLVSPPLDLGRR